MKKDLTSNGLCRKVVRSGFRLGISGSVQNRVNSELFDFSTRRQSARFMPEQYLLYAVVRAEI